MRSLRKLSRAAQLWLLLVGAALLTGAALLLTADVQGATAGVPMPVIEPARGGQCVKDPDYMRRNHMHVLEHQAELAVHGGVRDPRLSLKTCIQCHASQVSRSVAATKTDFCISCHTFAAVQTSCFECHAHRPANASAFPPLVHPTTGTTAHLTRQVLALDAQTPSAAPRP
jgi:hypothetical protein